MTAIPELRPFDVRLAGGTAPDARRALLGRPSPWVGEVVCALSDVGLEGQPIEPQNKSAGGSGAGCAVVFAIAFAMLGLGASIVISSYTRMSGALFGAIVLALAIPGGAIGRIVGRRSLRFEPECIYAGKNGVERVEWKGGALVRHGTPYAAAATMVRFGTREIVNGRYAGTKEGVALLAEGGKTLFLVQGYYDEAVPPPRRVEIAREVLGLAVPARAAAAAERLARGETLSFPRFGMMDLAQNFRITDEGIDLTRDRLRSRLRKGALSPLATVELPLSSIASAAVHEGLLTISSRLDAAQRLTVALNEIGDSRVLLELLAARGIVVR